MDGAARRAEREADAAARRAQQALGMHVLFIDDQTVNLRQGQRILESLGCSYKTLNDGETAMAEIESAIAAGAPFDAVLVDIIMARVDGITVCRSIRSANIDVPVVAMTAVADRNNLLQFKRAGFNLVLAKPFGADAVRQALVEAAKRERKRQAQQARLAAAAGGLA
jgi:CheY-like chemotaxis protein